MLEKSPKIKGKWRKNVNYILLFFFKSGTTEYVFVF